MAERRQPHRCWELVLASPSAAQCAVLEQKGCDPEIAKRFVLKHLDGGGIYVFIGLTRQLRMNQVLDTVLDVAGWRATNYRDQTQFAALAAGVCGSDDLVHKAPRREGTHQGARTDLRTHVAAVPPSVVPGTVRVLPRPPLPRCKPSGASDAVCTWDSNVGHWRDAEGQPFFAMPSGPAPRGTSGAVCTWDFNEGRWRDAEGQLFFVQHNPKRAREIEQRAALREAQRLRQDEVLEAQRAALREAQRLRQAAQDARWAMSPRLSNSARPALGGLCSRKRSVCSRKRSVSRRRRRRRRHRRHHRSSARAGRVMPTGAVPSPA